MLFDTIRRFIDPNETFTLYEKDKEPIENRVGNRENEWINITKIEGLIQRPQVEEINESGELSSLLYKGFFLINESLQIKINNLSNYRIYYNSPYEKICFKVVNYDPNLKFLGEPSHYELTLKEERKWQ